MDAAARADISPSADQFVATATSGPWPAFKANGAVDPAAEVFLRGLYADASPDELPEMAAADLAQNLAEFWQALGGRARAALNFTVTLSVQVREPVALGAPVAERVIRLRKVVAEDGGFASPPGGDL